MVFQKSLYSTAVELAVEQVNELGLHVLKIPIFHNFMSMQFSCRDLMRGMVGGAVSLALAPTAFAQVGPPSGKIALRFNENPYGPSAAAQKAAKYAVAQGAYYADSIQENILKTIAV